MKRSEAYNELTPFPGGDGFYTQANVSGAVQDSAIEVLIPGYASVDDGELEVYRDGVLATSGQDYRRKGQLIKVRLDARKQNVLVGYRLHPRAVNDDFTVSASANNPLVAAPGVLGNDRPGTGLTAVAVTSPAGFSLNSDGSITCDSPPADPGIYVFTYRAASGSLQSELATATVLVTPGTPLFVDDFTREALDENPLDGWTIPAPLGLGVQGDWNVARGQMVGASQWDTAGDNNYGFIYHANNWGSQDYSVEARIKFQPGAFGGGVGGRVSSDGRHYAVWVYPGSRQMKLVKFTTWSIFEEVRLVSLSNAVGTDWHTVKLAVSTTGGSVFLSVLYDDEELISSLEDSSSPFFSGGVSLDMWTASEAPANMSVDDVVVR